MASYTFAYFCGWAADRRLASSVAEIDKLRYWVELGSNFGSYSTAGSFNLSLSIPEKLHWNHNVYFAFLKASYTGDDESIHDVIVWNGVYVPKDSFRVKQRVSFNSALEDPQESLKGRKISYGMYYNAIPKSGMFGKNQLISPTYEIPYVGSD